MNCVLIIFSLFVSGDTLRRNCRSCIQLGGNVCRVEGLHELDDWRFAAIVKKQSNILRNSGITMNNNAECR
jgi:hypothetical protein